MNKVNYKYSNLIFFSLLFLVFYILDRFSPFIADDYAYKFFYDENIGGLSIVNSILDAVKFQAHDYMTHNGRFIVHTLTAYFCGKLGVEWFRIINSFIFILLVYGVLNLIRNEFGVRKTDKYIIAFVLFMFLPCPGMIVFGSIAMCINYLWTACAITYFIILFEKVVKRKNACNNAVVKILYFIVALLVGSLQESFSLGISAALFFYYCFHVKELKSSVLWIVIGFWLGTLIVTFAPGNFVRLGEVNNAEGELSISKLFSHFSEVIFNAKLFVVLCFLMLIFLFRNKSEFVKFVTVNALYFLTILFCFLISLIVFSGERQVTCIELFSFILIIKLLFRYCSDIIETNYRLINSFIIVLFILFYIPIYNNRAYAYNMLESLYKKPVVDNTIVFPEYWEHIRKLNGNYWGSHFTQKLDFSEKWMYSAFSNYLSDGKDSELVTAVLNESKSKIVEGYIKNNVDGCYNNTKYKYFVIRTPKDAPITAFKEYYKPFTFLGKVKSYMLNKKDTNCRNTEASSSFDDGLFRYYILNERSYEIKGMSLK